MTSILIAPLRPAPLLAKVAATVDVMSRGRLELGVGVGWHEAEYAACGVEFQRRGAVLDAVIGACRALWSGADASYESSTITFESLSSVPLPVQRPLPVLFAGGSHARNVARIPASVTVGSPSWAPHLPSSSRGSSEFERRVEATDTMLSRSSCGSNWNPEPAPEIGSTWTRRSQAPPN